MRTEAPTRLDRAVLIVVSGPVGHLVGMLLEVGSALGGIAAARLRAAFRRRRR